MFSIYLWYNNEYKQKQAMDYRTGKGEKMKTDINNCIIGMIPINEPKAFTQLLPDNFLGHEESTILIGAMAEGFAAGVIWAEMREEGREIMQLAVHPEFRRRGIGSKLIESFLSVVCQMDRMVSVYGFFVGDDNSKTLRSFLDSMGCFVLFEKGSVIRVTCTELRKSSGYNKLKVKEDGTKSPVSVFSMSQKEIQKIMNDMSKTDFLFPQDLLINKNEYEEKLCLCMINDKKIENAIFTRKTGKTLKIAYMYGKANLSGIRQLLCAFSREYEKGYKDFDIEAETDLPSVKRLINYIADGNTAEYPIFFAMWDMIRE